MTVDRLPGKEKVKEPTVAIQFNRISQAQREAFDTRIGSIHHGLHFETGSILVRPEDSRSLIAEFNGEDVTAAFEEITARTEGYRVVRVGSKFISEPFKGKGNKAMVIKNYATGGLTVYNEFGKVEGVILAEQEGVAFSGSRFETVLQEPLVFFDTLEEAVGSGQAT